MTRLLYALVACFALVGCARDWSTGPRDGSEAGRGTRFADAGSIDRSVLAEDGPSDKPDAGASATDAGSDCSTTDAEVCAGIDAALSQPQAGQR